jgi:hypothetical protein
MTIGLNTHHITNRNKIYAAFGLDLNEIIIKVNQHPLKDEQPLGPNSNSFSLQQIQ